MSSRIDVANDYVSIRKVLGWAGIYVPEVSYGRSWKTRCPFGEMYHIDMGSEKSMRVYSDTNSAYCFQGCGYLSPVSLHSKISGLPWQDAAEDLLQRMGYQDITDEEKWKKALDERRSVDPNYLSSALQVYCSKIAGNTWNYIQYDSRVLDKLKKCLSLLSFIKSEDDARKWLTASKLYLYSTLIEKVNNEISDG